MLTVQLDSVVDGMELRTIYGCFPSGVTAICSLEGEAPLGLAATSFTSVSLHPPLVSACFQESSATWPRLRASRRLGVTVLAAGQAEACRQLAMKTGDRFAGSTWAASESGAVFIHGGVAWFECSIYEEITAGDHKIALLEVHGANSQPAREPLVFHASQMRELSGI